MDAHAVTKFGVIGVAWLLAAGEARAGEGCDNGVPVGGTACAHQGDPVQYRCQPGSQPGASKWTQESCNGGTCQGAACTGAPPPPPNPPPAPEGCDNGVPVGGTACAHQGDPVQYRCQPGSRPGDSKWTQESCNGGTCQGAACAGAPPPPPNPPPNPPPPNPPPNSEGCDNGVPVGGTACANQGEDLQYRCLPGSRPGQSKWLPEPCGGGRRCLGASCQQPAPQTTCDGKPVGAIECKQPASDRFRKCVQGPQGAAWADGYCPMGQACSGGQCVASPDTCGGAPLGSRKCDVEGGMTRFECASTDGVAKWLWWSCGVGSECRAGTCVQKSLSCDGKPPGSRKCDFEGDSRYFECVPSAGFATWTVRPCNGVEECRAGQCVAKEPRCGDAPVGTRTCEAPGGFRVKICTRQGYNAPTWEYQYCSPGQECQQGQCVARNATCDGAPVGTRRCVVEGGTQRQECMRSYTDAPAQWATIQCGPNQTCALGTCMTLGKPQGAPSRPGRWPGAGKRPPRPQGRPE